MGFVDDVSYIKSENDYIVKKLDEKKEKKKRGRKAKIANSYLSRPIKRPDDYEKNSKYVKYWNEHKDKFNQAQVLILGGIRAGTSIPEICKNLYLMGLVDDIMQPNTLANLLEHYFPKVRMGIMPNVVRDHIIGQYTINSLNGEEYEYKTSLRLAPEIVTDYVLSLSNIENNTSITFIGNDTNKDITKDNGVKLEEPVKNAKMDCRYCCGTGVVTNAIGDVLSCPSCGGV